MKRFGSIPSAPIHRLHVRLPRALTREERCAGRAGTLQLPEPPARRVQLVPPSFPVSWPRPKLHYRILATLKRTPGWLAVIGICLWLGMVTGASSRFYEEDAKFRSIVQQARVWANTEVSVLQVRLYGRDGHIGSVVSVTTQSSTGQTFYPPMLPVSEQNLRILGKRGGHPEYHKFKGLPPQEVTHVVGVGDNFSVIAADVFRNFGPITVKELEAQTGIKPEKLKPGMKLTFEVKPWIDKALKANGQS